MTGDSGPPAPEPEPPARERPPGEQAAWETQGWGVPQPPPDQPSDGPPAGPPPPGYGAPGDFPAYPPPPRPTSSRASTILVLGIVSLVTFFVMCGLGVVPAIIALAMAPAARREIAASGGALEGAGQVRAGTIMAWVTVGLTALAIVVVVVVIAFAVAVSDSSTAVHMGPASAGLAAAR